MPKDIPPFPDFKPPTYPPPGLTARTYDISLITPMFGGGVEPRVNDRRFPIRPTAIRGQLQFWWRATVGAQYTSVDELRAAQMQIWGSTDRASRVQAIVKKFHADEPLPCARYAPKHDGALQIAWHDHFSTQENALPYALFPFQGQLSKDRRKVEQEPATCIPKARFELRLQFPTSMEAEIEAAVWAWVNFGGLGCRTRRGCGAIRCERFAPRDHLELKAQLAQFAPNLTAVREWPTISKDILSRTEGSDPRTVWSWLIGQYKFFRQGVDFARNRGQQANRPGRSRFPEPETIRETLRADRSRSGHQRLPKIPADALPRAELGLPIIYELRGNGEPPKTTVQPIVDGKPGDRMASPLILKPLSLASGQAIPLILRLNGPQLKSVVLMQGQQEQRRFDSDGIRGSRLTTSGDQPMSYSKNGSALEAFLNFIQSPDLGFTEVTR